MPLVIVAAYSALLHDDRPATTIIRMELHPFATMFPRLPEEEFAQLKNSIAQHGQIHPITVCAGMVLDGSHRYQACVELGIKPICSDLPDNMSAAEYVAAANLQRRHLTPQQRAALAIELGIGETVTERAQLAGVSERTQRYAQAVAKTDPDAIPKIARGEISLNEVVKSATKVSNLPVAAQSVDQEALTVQELRDELVRMTEEVEALRRSSNGEHLQVIDELRNEINGFRQRERDHINQISQLKRQLRIKSNG